MSTMDKDDALWPGCAVSLAVDLAPIREPDDADTLDQLRETVRLVDKCSGDIAELVTSGIDPKDSQGLIPFLAHLADVSTLAHVILDSPLSALASGVSLSEFEEQADARSKEFMVALGELLSTLATIFKVKVLAQDVPGSDRVQ